MIDEEAPVLRLLIELCAQFVGAEEGSLLVVDGADDPPQALVFAMTVGSPESKHALIGQRVPLGEGVVGLAAVTHEVQIGAPTYEGVVQARRGEVAPDQPSSVLAAPVLANDELLGVITAVRFGTGPRFTADHALLYGRVAAVAGLLLHRGRRLASSTGPGAADRSSDERLRSAVARLADLHAAHMDELVRLLEGLAHIGQGEA
jgi:GAF domain-containing protein